MKKRIPKAEYVMEKSCGAVLYKMVDGKPRFVLVRGAVFGFPKGHVERGETERETALREIREETGVTPVLDTSFRREVIYRSPRFRNGKKRVVFFTAECPEDETPEACGETKELLFVTLDEALKILKLDTLRQVLLDASAHISKKNR
ncbi:MAG: NUDIX domain-containing protein [Clostridia bacterium]|nr:NUDIX domain-containing protein [Clostridia bacterium]